jgi:hypothetical protein
LPAHADRLQTQLAEPAGGDAIAEAQVRRLDQGALPPMQASMAMANTATS